MNLLVSSDEELISLFQSGNNEAFAILLHRYADQIKHSIRQIISSIEEAEDVFQDLSIHFSIKLKTAYKENGKFGGWLHCVVDNYLCSYCRKMKPKITDLDLEAVKDWQKEYELSSQDREHKYAELRKSVKELPEELRILVEMKIWKRMTLEAIAVKLNSNKSTIAKRLQSAYHQLEKSMLAKGYDDAFI